MATAIGVARRLRRFIGDGPSLILPLDDALISGPGGHLQDVRTLLSKDLLQLVDGVVGHRGLLKVAARELAATPFIVNLSASTILSRHTHKTLVTSVLAGAEMGADAVAFHLNVSDDEELDMLHSLGRVIDEADSLGMPVFVIAYPRRSGVDGDDNYEVLQQENPSSFVDLVRHTVRIAVELGAAVVKTVYTGSSESFSEVVEAACGVPVLVAGGPPGTEEEGLEKAEAVVAAGAVGVAYGRHIFMNPAPVTFARLLRQRMDSAAGIGEALRESYSNVGSPC